MIDKIVFKRQAKSKDVNGVVPARDSWWIYYKDKNRIPELVFENPNNIKLNDISNIDLSTLTFEHWNQLRVGLGLEAVTKSQFKKSISLIEKENEVLITNNNPIKLSLCTRLYNWFINLFKK